MIKKFSIKKATTKDALKILNISKKTFVESFGQYHNEKDMKHYINQSFTLEKIKQALKDKSIIFYIVTFNDNIIGYAKLNCPKNQKEIKKIQLERLYIKKNFQKNKLGSKLMKKALIHSKKHNFNIFYLSVWQENKKAIKFYESFGLKKYSRKFFKLGNMKRINYLMKTKLN